MLNGKRIAVVLPAYNAEKTLEATVRELPDLVDIRILVDDHSSDRTVEIAHQLGLQFYVHDQNYGYGRNQQTCYREALAEGADVVIMLHPDYQYTPLLVTAMASMVAFDVYDVVLGSRIIGGRALQGGMPVYKYVFNRMLTAFQNIFLRVKLSEYHTGYRAFSRKVLLELPLLENSDDFVFDNQVLAQCVHFGFRIGEVSCPTKYFEEGSSINFRRSVTYGLGVLGTTLQRRRNNSLLLPRNQPKHIAGKFIRKSETSFRSRIQIHRGLVEPNHGSLSQAILWAGPVIGRTHHRFAIMLEGVIVKRQALARRVLRAAERFREAVERYFIGGEDHSMIQ